MENLKTWAEVSIVCAVGRHSQEEPINVNCYIFSSKIVFNNLYFELDFSGFTLNISCLFSLVFFQIFLLPYFLLNTCVSFFYLVVPMKPTIKGIECCWNIFLRTFDSNQGHSVSVKQQTICCCLRPKVTKRKLN